MVHGERRNRLRFPLETELRFQVPGERRSKAAIQGIGQAENMSSRGLAFRTETPIHTGSRLSVSLAWPAQLDNHCILRLVVEGKITRTDGDLVVLQIERHDFRTSGKGAVPARQELVTLLSASNLLPHLGWRGYVDRNAGQPRYQQRPQSLPPRIAAAATSISVGTYRVTS